METITAEQERDLMNRQLEAADPRWGEFFAAVVIAVLLFTFVNDWIHP